MILFLLHKPFSFEGLQKIVQKSVGTELRGKLKNEITKLEWQTTNNELLFNRLYPSQN